MQGTEKKLTEKIYGFKALRNSIKINALYQITSP